MQAYSDPSREDETTTCKIQWVDEQTGKPTPDTNPAIGIAYREAYTSQHNGRGVKHERSADYPICAEHRARMAADEAADPVGMRDWRFVPFATDAEAPADAREGREDGAA
jgi:hypothetical protein